MLSERKLSWGKGKSCVASQTWLEQADGKRFGGEECVCVCVWVCLCGHFILCLSECICGRLNNRPQRYQAVTPGICEGPLTCQKQRCRLNSGARDGKIVLGHPGGL